MSSTTRLMTCTESSSFIEENHEYKRQSQARQSRQFSQPGRPSQDMMSFWGEFKVLIRHCDLLICEGYKFETLCLLPRPWDETPREYIENRENEIVNNHAQYCSVVQTGIGSTTMVLGGEVDACMIKSSSYVYPTLTLSSMGLQTIRRRSYQMGRTQNLSGDSA